MPIVLLCSAGQRHRQRPRVGRPDRRRRGVLEAAAGLLFRAGAAPSTAILVFLCSTKDVLSVNLLCLAAMMYCPRVVSSVVTLHEALE